MAKKPTPPVTGQLKGANSKTGNALDPDTMVQNMNVPPQMMGQFTGIVKAGMTLVLHDDTHHLLQQSLTGPGPVSLKLAQGILGLMTILNSQAKGAIPPQLFVPCGLYLLARVAKFLNESGMAKISPQDIAEGIRTFVHLVLQKLQQMKNTPGAGAPQGQLAGAQAQPPQGPPGGQVPPQPGPALPSVPAPPAAAPGLAPGAQATPQPGGGA